VPNAHKPVLDTQKVKVTDPATGAVVTSRTSKAGAQNSGGQRAPAQGSIQAPLERPAGAFQPLAVDPQLMAEWAARGKQGTPPPGASAQAAKAPAGGQGSAGGADGNATPWAVTEKIDRAALAGLAQGKGVKLPDDGGAGAGRPSQEPESLRGILLPLFLTILVGTLIGVVIIKVFLLPKREASKGDPGTSTAAAMVESAAPSSGHAPSAGAATAPGMAGATTAGTASAAGTDGLTPGTAAPGASQEEPVLNVDDPAAGGVTPVPPVGGRPWPRPQPTPTRGTTPSPTSTSVLF
jgi:predicted RecA/RadA family phage recombinase